MAALRDFLIFSSDVRLTSIYTPLPITIVPEIVFLGNEWFDLYHQRQEARRVKPISNSAIVKMVR